MKRRLALLAFVLVIVLLTLTTSRICGSNTSIHQTEPSPNEEATQNAESTEVKHFGVPLLTDFEIYDPEIAKQYGIPGYVIVRPTEGTPLHLYMEKEMKVSLTILLQFVSYKEDLTEMKVNLDPNSGFGLEIEQCFPGGSVSVSKLVTYDPSGTIMLKAGQTLPVKMIVNLPEDFSRAAVSSFRLAGVAISMSIALIDCTEVWIHV